MKGFGMNPPGMNQFSVNQSIINAGPFMGTSSGGMNLPGMSQRMGHRGILDQSPQGFQQRFVGPGPQHNMGQQSMMRQQTSLMGVQSEQQKMDSRLPKDKMSLRDAVHQLAMETKNISNRWDGGIGSSGGLGINQMSSPQIMEHSRNVQNRYTTESATSILASFGLSNEDLEELSRYPDNQLTPDNMPVILREIRLRKVNRQVPSMNSQGRGGVGDTIQSKVFDYGHSSKFGYNEEPLETRVFNSPMGDEPRKDFHTSYTQSGGSMDGQHSVGTQGRFPVEKSMGQLGFPNETTKHQLNFPGGPTSKMPALDTASSQKIQSLSTTQAGLPIEVLERKYGRNKNQPKMNNPPGSMGTQPMANLPSLQMTTPPPNFQMANPPPNFQMVNPPPNFHIDTPPPSFQMGNRPGLQTGASGSPMNFQVHAESSMQPPMPPPTGQTSFGKVNWSPLSSQPDVLKTKQLPTPSMMNDYYAASPRIFPHMCSLCNIECKHLKDWIQHQNTNTHIESCRQIRNKYPDWNPQALDALRNEADKKENQTLRRRSESGDSSPRHSRSSGSTHRVRRSRSRSPDNFARPRTRSRSPRRALRRSPRRSRSPRRRTPSPRIRRSRFSPRYQRTASAERSSSKTNRSPGNAEKRSSETGHTSSAPSAQTDLSKQKSGKPTIIGKRIPDKPVSKMQSVKKPGSDSASARKSGSDGASARRSSSDGNMARKPSTSTDSTSKKPSTSSMSQKLSTSSTLPKKSDADSISLKMPISSISLEEHSHSPSDVSQKSRKKRKRVRPPPSSSPKEVYNSLPWFKNKMDPETVIHITDLPDDGYTDQDILKVVQPFGKASDILIVRCKNEAYLEMSFREAAIAAVKFSETVPVMINKKRIRLTSVGHKPPPVIGERRSVVEAAQIQGTAVVPSKKPIPSTRPSEKLAEKSLKPDFSLPKQTIKVNPKASNATAAKVPEVIKSTSVQKSEEAKKGAKDSNENLVRKRRKPVDENVDFGVILVTNFPEKEYSAEEVANLAKPFGGVKDVILLSSHKQAYLQLSQSSAESMIKFYTVFPMSLAGKQLSIKLIPKYKSIKDVERIFIDLIEAEESVRHPDIHERFVHLRNLPKDGYTDLEVAYLGLRFGKVTNYVVIRNKRKAILQLDSMKAAKAMFNFTSSYPCCLGGNTLKCTLSPKRKLLPGEAVIDEDSDEGSDLENMDETECAQMAYEPPVKPKLSDTSIERTVAPSTQMDIAKPEPRSNAPNSATKGQAVKVAEGESEARVITLSKPVATKLVKLGGIKKKLLKKRSTITLESSAKLKFKRIALQPKLMKKNKLKGKNLISSLDGMQVVGNVDKRNISMSDQPMEEATKSIAEAMSPDSSTTVPMVSTEDEPMSNKNETTIIGKSEPLKPGTVKDKKGVIESVKMVENDGKSRADSEGATADAKNTVLRSGKESEATGATTLGTAAKCANSRKPTLNGGTEARKTASSVDADRAVAANHGAVGEKIAVKSGLEEQKNASKSAMDAEKSTNKVGVEPGKHFQNRFTNPERAYANTNKKDQTKVDIKNPSNVRSGACKMTANDKPNSSTVTTNPASLPQKMTSTKSGDQKSSSRYETSKKAFTGKTSGKETSTRPSSSTSSSPHIVSKLKQNVDSVSRRSTGRSSSSMQQKDLRGDSRSLPKSQERDKSSTKKDDHDNQTIDYHELFPFNMDEFVTVDELEEEMVDDETPEKIVEEENSSSKSVPQSGKRKEPSKETPPIDPNSKRRNESSTPCPPKQDNSFVTLDELGEEAAFAAQPEASSEAVRSPPTRTVAKRIAEKKRPVKAPNVIMTLDEVSDEEDLVFQGTAKDNCSTNVEDPGEVSKVKPRVTLKVVEEGEKPVCAETSGLNIEGPLQVKVGAAKASGDSNGTSSSVPDRCSTTKADKPIVDRDEQALVTLDEFNAEEDDFMHNMDGFSEEHQFVTVDEIGEEEDDEMAQCEETPAEQDKAKSTRDDKNNNQLEDSTAKDDEMESKRKKMDSPIKMPAYDPKVPVGLEFLIPKTGYFCELCSLFYMDDASKFKHCKTLRHYNCVEKHMTQKQGSYLKQSSSTVQEKL